MEYSTDNIWIVLGIISLVLFLLILLPLLPGIVVTAIVRRRVETVIKRNSATIITQYKPPLDLSAAEIGLLYDSACDAKEIRATLFELQQRGVIVKNTENSVTVVDQSAYAQLPEYARIAVRMFDRQTAKADPGQLRSIVTTQTAGDTPTTVTLLSIPTRQTRRAFTRAVQDSIRARGIAIRDYHKEFYKRILYLYLFFWSLPGIFIIMLPAEINGVSYPAFSLQNFLSAPAYAFGIGFLLFPVYLALSFATLAIFVKIAGRYWINTKQVRQLWPELAGYKRFLEATDLSRIQFESQQTTHKPVIDTLPYAIVFNLETKWRKRL